MRTEQKRFQSFLLLIASCVLLFTSFGCGTGGGQAAAPFDDSNQNSPPPANSGFIVQSPSSCPKLGINRSFNQPSIS